MDNPKKLKIIAQITEAHCGPAVVQMLLKHIRRNVSQEEVVKAGRAKGKLKTHGMTVQEMAKAVNKLVPDVTFWYKDKATLKDMTTIIHKHKHPVGVEWQGIFGSPGSFGESDSDPGHYSIVVSVHKPKNEINIVDPYYPKERRTISLMRFLRRWWDTNEIKKRMAKRKKNVKDYHMLFIITSKKATFPQDLNMVKL